MRILAMCAHINLILIRTIWIKWTNTRTIIKSKTKRKRKINYPIAHHQGNCMHRRHSSLLDCTQRWKIKWNWHDASHHRLVMPTINYPRDKLCTPTERSDPWNGYTKEKVFLSICYATIEKTQKKTNKQILYTQI